MGNSIWHDGKEIPEKSGEYEVRNNSGCNNGEGYIYFTVGKGWDIPECIQSFYKILKWREV